MRIYAFALAFLALSACKVKDEAIDTSDADADADADADSDVDTDVDTDADTDTVPIDPECFIESDAGLCYDCELPTAPEGNSDKFLNQCSDADFAYFDNAARIPSSTWTPGTPLPEIP